MNRQLLGPFPRVIACVAVGCGCWTVIVAGGIAALGGLPDPFMAFIPLAGAPLGLAAGFFHDRPFSLVVVTNALGGCMSLPAFFTWNLLLAIPVPALANLSVILALLAMEPAVRVGERER